MPNIVYIAASLDGYIATTDGGIDWLEDVPNPSHRDYGWAEFIARIDAIVMGANTFRKVLSFGRWPYEKPVLVVTHSIEQLPRELEGRVQFVQGTPQQLVETAKEQGFESLYIDGGLIIQQFLEEDLIDEMVITQVPVLLGDGIPLFGRLTSQRSFLLAKVETFDQALVKSTYLRKH